MVLDMATTRSTKPPPAPAEPVRSALILGVSELSDFLGVKPSTVHVWGYRKSLPDPDFDPVNGYKAWRRLTIVKWAAETGRLPAWLQDEGGKFVPDGGYKRKRRTPEQMAADGAPSRSKAAKVAPRKAAAKKAAVRKAVAKRAAGKR